ncbi:uncharacterized protein LOC132044950 [Lycium ferocissimum]|uniref:uncharacterized protein LOC132044950 n=1 Tax=Lycium ferocissimum TaxID=112874 RepID=UPI002814D2DD|nr:uncharacterized protein LOC132044950 [Lycium ferocissimum]
MLIPKTASWVVRKIIASRELVLQGQVADGTLQTILKSALIGNGFAIRKMYLTLLPQHPKVEWKSLSLQASIHPRYKFILWLALHQRLATVDRLMKLGIQVPPDCAFCGLYRETFAHLFFECAITRQMWYRLCVWMGYRRNIADWNTEVKWACKLAKKRAGLAEISSCAFAMIVDAIWREWNKLRFQNSSLLAAKVLKDIVIQLNIRGQANRRWYDALQGLNAYP